MRDDNRWKRIVGRIQFEFGFWSMIFGLLFFAVIESAGLAGWLSKLLFRG